MSITYTTNKCPVTNPGYPYSPSRWVVQGRTNKGLNDMSQTSRIEMSKNEVLESKFPIAAITSDFVALRKSFPDDVDLQNRYLSFVGSIKVQYRVNAMDQYQNHIKLTVPDYTFWSDMVAKISIRLTGRV